MLRIVSFFLVLSSALCQKDGIGAESTTTTTTNQATTTKITVCEGGTMSCYEGGPCDALECDGIPQCPDGRDENNCQAVDDPCEGGSMRCYPGGRCDATPCNNIPECPDGRDEAPSRCAETHVGCASNEFLCVSDGACIPDEYRCDCQHEDCSDGSDENRGCECCDLQYNNITSESRNLLSTGTDMCDDTLSEDWYRFMLNGQSAELATQCLRPDTCGTKLPLRVELHGQKLPKSGYTIDAAACTVHDILDKWDCCVLSQNIKITKCGAHFLYYLKPVDRCPVSYCVQAESESVPVSMTAEHGRHVVEQVVSTTTTTTTITAATATVTTDIPYETTEIETSPTDGIVMVVSSQDSSAVYSTTEQSTTCHRREFECRDGTCIRGAFRCDGIGDCPDNSDEDRCIDTADSTVTGSVTDVTDEVVTMSPEQETSSLHSTTMPPTDMSNTADSTVTGSVTDVTDEVVTMSPEQETSSLHSTTMPPTDMSNTADSTVTGSVTDITDEVVTLSPEQETSSLHSTTMHPTDMSNTADSTVTGSVTDITDEVVTMSPEQETSSLHSTTMPPTDMSTCLPGEFKCRDGTCIRDTLRCDGITDCLDNSDEERCVDTADSTVTGSVTDVTDEVVTMSPEQETSSLHHTTMPPTDMSNTTHQLVTDPADEEVTSASTLELADLYTTTEHSPDISTTESRRSVTEAGDFQNISSEVQSKITTEYSVPPSLRSSSTSVIESVSSTLLIVDSHVSETLVVTVQTPSSHRQTSLKVDTIKSLIQPMTLSSLQPSLIDEVVSTLSQEHGVSSLTELYVFSSTTTASVADEIVLDSGSLDVVKSSELVSYTESHASSTDVTSSYILPPRITPSVTTSTDLSLLSTIKDGLVTSSDTFHMLPTSTVSDLQVTSTTAILPLEKITSKTISDSSLALDDSSVSMTVTTFSPSRGTDSTLFSDSNFTSAVVQPSREALLTNSTASSGILMSKETMTVDVVITSSYTYQTERSFTTQLPGIPKDKTSTDDSDISQMESTYAVQPTSSVISASSSASVPEVTSESDAASTARSTIASKAPSTSTTQADTSKAVTEISPHSTSPYPEYRTKLIFLTYNKNEVVMLIRQMLASALTKVLNLFMSQKQRQKRSILADHRFSESGIRILDDSRHINNTFDRVEIVFNVTSDTGIPILARDIIDLLENDTVRSFLEKEMNLALIGMCVYGEADCYFSTLPPSTTTVAVPYDDRLFEDNYILYIILVVVGIILLIFLCIMVICIRKQRHRGTWYCRKPPSLTQSGKVPISEQECVSVENPATDEEIMKDEAMPPDSPTATLDGSAGSYSPDQEDGWVVPIDEISLGEPSQDSMADTAL